MKTYIIGIGLSFVFTLFTIYQYEYNLHQEQIFNLKFVAEEAAAGAAQYILLDYYTNGYLVFNQGESIKAVEYILHKNLNLSLELFPGTNSYFTEQISYDIKFFDDLNTNYPYLYEDFTYDFSLTITNPTVVILINAGKPSYKLIENLPNVISIAAHEWNER